ncbi:MAG TPA: hypothetical protein VJO14_00905, partial [Bacteroidota bacterium]|nr:hypothetical protein [Bacteroidota bacterium]
MRIRTILPTPRPAGTGHILSLGLFLLYSVFAVIHLLEKPGLPTEYRFPRGTSQVTSVDGVAVKTANEVEFLLSGFPIGARVGIVIEHDELTGNETVTLDRYYSGWYILFDVAISAIILGLGLVVAMFHVEKSVARVFMGASIALAGALLGTKTLSSMQPYWLGAGLCACFFLSYSAIPVLFLHFASVFPVRRFRNTRTIAGFFYAGTVLMAVWQTLVYLEAGEPHSVEMFRRSVSTSVWMNGLMVAGIVAGLLVLIVSY